MEESDIGYFNLKDITPLQPPPWREEDIPAPAVSNRRKIYHQISRSRTQVVLTILVSILAILTTVFITLYFTTEGKGKPCDFQNSLANKENKSCNDVEKKCKPNCDCQNCSLVQGNTAFNKAKGKPCNDVEKKCKACDCQNCSLVQGNTGTEKSMLFNRKNITDYAISPGAHGDLMAITACLWAKVRETPEEQTFISYAVTGGDNEFYVAEEFNYLVFALKNSGPQISNVTSQDGEWHAICYVWSSKKGQYKLYKDGKVVIQGSCFNRDERILGGGTWVLGQDQDVVGGRFDPTQMVLGEMTEVNIWDKELSYEEIQEFSTSCQSKLRGNVKSWNDFIAGVKGEVKIVERPTCYKPKV